LSKAEPTLHLGKPNTMTIIRYNEAPQNPHAVASQQGAPQFLDLSSGHLFDAAGNTIARWIPRDDEDTAVLADYAAEYAFGSNCASIGQTNPQLATHMMRSWTAQQGGEGSAIDSILMDLGPSDVHVPAAIPNFASGYSNFEPMADLFAPAIPVGKQVNDYWQFDRNDAFQRAMPSLGTGGGAVPEISARLAAAQYSCVERAMGGFVTTQTEANADAPLKIRQATARRCVDALLLEREIRVQALGRTTTNWDSSLVITVAAGFQWNGGPSSDPVKDLHTMIEAQAGIVTGILMPENVNNAFVRNAAVRAYYGFKSDTPGIPDMKQMQSILRLPPIYVAKMKYLNSSGTLSYVWGSDVVLFRQPQEMPPTNQEDVASAYTFRWTMPDLKDGAQSGGFIVRQFFVQDRGTAGGNKIVVLHNDSEKITSKYIGGVIVNAFQ